MKQTKNPEMKTLLMNLLTFSDEITTEGKPVKIATMPKKYLKDYNRLRTKLLEGIRCEYYKENVTGRSFGEGKLSVVASMPDIKITSEYMDGATVEIEEGDLGVVRYLYEMREEIPVISSATFTELEELLAK